VSPRTKPRTVVAFIDSLDRERGVARLVEGEGAAGGATTHSFPAALLPDGAGEGAWIELRVTPVEPPAGQDPTSLRRALGRGDDGGDIKL
jgi:hypothetical protein